MEIENEEVNSNIDDNDDSIIIDLDPELELDNDEQEQENDQDDDLDLPESSVIKDIRKANRDKDKRIKELEEKLNNIESKPKSTEEQKPTVLRPRPQLSDANIDFDEDKYTAETEAWLIEKIEHDNKVKKQKDEENRRIEAEQIKLKDSQDRYAKHRIGIDNRIIEAAEKYVNESFNGLQRTIIMQKCDNAPQVVIALKSNPEIAKKLLSTDDPIDFAFALKEFESKIKVRNRPTTQPELTIDSKPQKGSGYSKSMLEQLEREAERTGDRTKLIAYRRSHITQKVNDYG